MDRLFSPWRYQYITTSPGDTGCVFCTKQQESDDAALIVFRARLNYVVVNLYPYSSGHIMVVPYEHGDRLSAFSEETTGEMMALVRRGEEVLRKVYRAPGINVGMNIGSCAGAGVAGHIHMHLLPRWPGDVNFLTAVGETRVLPEEVQETWRKLRGAFPAGA